MVFEEFKDEINQIKNDYIHLNDDSAFVFWFVNTILDNENESDKATVGTSNDKGIDAIWINNDQNTINIVQGKFRKMWGKHHEHRNDILSLVELGSLPFQEDKLPTFYEGLDPTIQKIFKKAVSKIIHDNYEINLFYVTTGRCSEQLRKEARKYASNIKGIVNIFINDYSQLEIIFKDWLEGVAGSVRSLSLKINSIGFDQDEGIIRRYDPNRKIETWIFSMTGKDVGSMFQEAGIKLFSRNIRGLLASKEVNASISETIKNEPENFWYFNNGITIVCDDATQKRRHGEDVLELQRPQIINGQQTARALHSQLSDKANVLVKVIKIPRVATNVDYTNLVNEIVKATNWQNKIEYTDLISNDPIQVYLERKFKNMRYQYLRKRQKKSEARSSFGIKPIEQISKEKLAKAVASCLPIDSVIVRKGIQHLFNKEKRFYQSIFNSKDPYFYLSRYFLMDYVGWKGQGIRRRSYPKWLVLHFTWEKLSPIIGTAEGSRRLKYLWEKGASRSAEKKLGKIISYIFDAAHTFYKKESGTGKEEKDLSSFFNQAGLDKQFNKFWQSSSNKYAKKTQVAIKQFKTDFNKLRIG